MNWIRERGNVEERKGGLERLEGERREGGWLREARVKWLKEGERELV